MLVALHLAAPRIRRLPLVPERATGSFAGGLAVAYVFLHLLPEVAEGNEAVGEALSQVLEPTPLLDLGIFLVALCGFMVFYGLERLADRHSDAGEDRQSTSSGGDRSAARGGQGTSTAVRTAPPAAPARSAAVFRLHLGSFLVYNALITYTMPLRLRTGVAFALLFAVAMALHFVLTDRGLEEHYPRQFGTRSRLLLALALLGGWAAAALFAPSSTLLVALLTALVAGSILLKRLQGGAPVEPALQLPLLLSGLLLYSALLGLVTAVSE